MRTLIRWLLLTSLPVDYRTALVGDLDEAYESMRARRGPVRAGLWYLRESISALTHNPGATMASSQTHVSARSRMRGFFVVADIRFALRRWRRRPGFAIAAALTLGIGIGATTAIYSVIGAVLLAPPPWTEPDRLVVIHAVFPDRRANPLMSGTWDRGQFSCTAWDAFKSQPEFADVAAWRRRGLDTSFGVDKTTIVETMSVSSRLLPALGVPLALGRTFTAEEDLKVSDSVLVTWEAWQRLFGGDADIIGKTATIGSISSGGRQVVHVVGVVSRGFAFEGGRPDLIFPVGIGGKTCRAYPSDQLRLVARLSPDTSIGSATAAAQGIARAVETREPTTARVAPLVDEQWRGAARPLWTLFAGAGILLLVACANVAGLLLAETQARRHEIAVRTALGGSRLRVARQLLIEHLFLGAAGAAAGILLAFLVMQAFIAVAPATLPRVDSLALDGRVVAFALGLSAISLLLFGVAPAIAIARTRTAGVLAEGGREGAPRRFAGHRVIVSGAIALALVLLVGASLLGETLYRLTTRPLGFDASNLAIVSFRLTGLPPMDTVRPTPGEYRGMSVEERAGYINRFLKMQTSVWATHLDGAMARLMAIPSVTSVGGSYSAPLTGARPSMKLRAATSAESASIPIRLLSVDANYFTAMRIPILRGRALAGTDRIGRVRLQPGTPAPASNVVISRDLERRLFGGDAVGQQLLENSGDVARPLNIVGVVDDVRWRGYGDDDLSVCYTIGEGDSTINTLVVRTAHDPTPLLPAMRAALRDYDPKFVVTETTTLEAALGRSIAEERLGAQLSAMFGGAALLLAAVGLYGLSSRRVAHRRREIGVRVALGALPRDVRRMVLRDALLTTVIGLAIGLPLAYSGSQLTQALLFQVTATAPRTFVLAAIVLMAAALLAAFLPARRAAAIDPIVVLKE